MHADYVIKGGYHLASLHEIQHAEKNKYLRLNNVRGNTGYFCGGKVKGRKIYPDDSHSNHSFKIFYKGTKQ